MKVTAVISTCKREPDRLRKAIESVLNQDYKSIELFVVDDSPSDYKLRDDVMRLCETYANRGLTYIRNEKQLGACATRNKGAAAGTGKYLAFLDDDDEWLSSKISKQVAALEEHPDCSMVYADYYLINEGDGTITKNSDSNIPCSGMVYDDLISRNFIGTTSVPLIRRDAFESVGGFDVNQPAMQDWDLWIRISEKYKIYYLRECLTNYYIHVGEHITKSPVKRRIGLERLNEKQRDYLECHTNAKVGRYYYLMRLYIAEGNVKQAIKCYGIVVKNTPGSVIQNLKRLKAFGRLIIKPSKGWS